MENEDSTKALYCDPNAFIHHKPQKKDPPMKVVFAEPYECLPSYYMDNNFKKGNCDCVKCNKPPKPPESPPQKPKSFDIKNLLPLLGLFGGNVAGKTGDFSSILSLLSPNGGGEQVNPISMISSLLSNSGGLNNILNIFKPKENKEKRPLKTTDFEIKNYTCVE